MNFAALKAIFDGTETIRKVVVKIAMSEIEEQR
ncbi:Uncharacterised protein [Mannheimia haemolytica]|uniref:Uncharacterized protein n=1 Tax=Mannheimia haemolytica TaxID=75985 RepID=A0A378MW53_MANHA|nr:hypothetical protein F382_07955 [Mannheimia haemolytica D153]AGQ41408.1 hypothetical protein J451_08015 [Mannheimia haemolytica D174]EPZ00140.1 hypothetical protein L279_04285 [Mannheimia haemolytica D38]EPZ28075.1 hypothetical protein L281_02285 [Mannheimia haemolytica MhSwine2000]STY59625.1 Uncharacterised protein [Mannheimia haemolytica]